VLVVVGAFWPGNDASGPNQSFISLASLFREQFDFRFVARDRPFGARTFIARSGEWVDHAYGKAMYLNCKGGRAIGLRAVLRETPHDLLWLNGFFDREFTIPILAMRRLGGLPKTPVLLSPRGEFGAGALGLKGGRKRVYLSASRHLGLLRNVTMHATSDQEAADIRACAPWIENIVVAPNVRAPLRSPDFVRASGPALRVAFVGRISPVKQLHYALDVLARVSSPVEFEIFGPAQDEPYWRRCEVQIAALPARVKVTWRGEMANETIVEALGSADLFLLPTAGENFGHAIFEALSCGVPVLISDQTPWRELSAARAGWDLPLDAPEAFAAAIDEFAATASREREAWREGARVRALAYLRTSGAVDANSKMITATIGVQGSANT
jgi:glycosyltransferase involved in cell wall biosynthesis